MSNKPKRDKNAKVKNDLRRWCERAGDDFHRDLGIAVINERKRLQKRINTVIDRPTPFTQRAVNSFSRQVTPYRSDHKIFIMDEQEKYLGYLFRAEYGIEKFIPMRKMHTNQFGNIKFLNNGKKPKKYITEKSEKGDIYLINPKIPETTRNKKRLAKRVVAVMRTTDRKAVLGAWSNQVKTIRENIDKRIAKRVEKPIKFV